MRCSEPLAGTESFSYEPLGEFTPSKSITRFCEREPDMTELLRLCYWYYKCYKVDHPNFFKYKSIEVRRKLAQGILSNIFEYATRVKYTETEVLGETEREFLSWLQQAPDTKFPVYVEKLSEAVRNVTSELMLAGLCSYNGYKLLFDACPSDDHDYDFLVNNIPVQVKTPNPSDNLPTSIEKVEELAGSTSNNLGEINEEIARFLSNLTGLRLMERALEQGA